MEEEYSYVYNYSGYCINDTDGIELGTTCGYEYEIKSISLYDKCYFNLICFNNKCK